VLQRRREIKIIKDMEIMQRNKELYHQIKLKFLSLLHDKNKYNDAILSHFLKQERFLITRNK